MKYRVHLAWVGFELTMLVVIGTDCIGSYKSNYHTITTSPPTVVQVIFTIHVPFKQSVDMMSCFVKMLMCQIQQYLFLQPLTAQRKYSF
jgi:hypothetical protein